MIVDGFTFFNEFDLLDSRLAYLDDAVDQFILVESNVTYTGKKKPLWYLENQARYSRFRHKIIYYPLLFDNSEHHFNFNITLNATDYNSPFWHVEYMQRNKISEAALKFFNSRDLLLISDVDEIPNKDAIRFVANNLLPPSNSAGFSQLMYYYNLSSRKQFRWTGTAATTVENLKIHDAQWFRNNRYSLPEVYNGGWHCSYFGGVEQIVTKLESFSHQEYNKDQYKSKDRIQDAISNSRDLFGRDNEDLIHGFDPTNFSEEFLEHFGRFRT